METIMSLRKFNKTSLRDEAYLSLKRTILTGEISQGQGLAINLHAKKIILAEIEKKTKLYRL